MKTYIVYDGRAHDDPDKATILDYMGEIPKKEALKEFKREWRNQDACLFEYSSKGNKLTNGNMISFQG